MKRQPFNDNWIYWKEGSQERKIVNLPHDAMIHDERRADSEGNHANAFFVGGVYVYEKKLHVPDEWRNKTIFLELEGVYRNSHVLINGRKAGERAYGYSTYTVAMDEYLKYSEENHIRIVADNSKLPNSRWYSGGGIYRPVNLIIGNKKHIRWEDGVKISTTSYSPAKVLVETQADDGNITVEIRDGEKVVASGIGNKVELNIQDAKLWSEDNPFLYQCRVILSEDNQILDEVIEFFGIRFIEYSPKGLFINGKETLLRGGCIHSDNGILGACTYPEAEERRVKLLKDLGYNALRISHNPASRFLLEACDRYGMYVMDEAFDMWYMHKNKYDYASDFDACHLQDLESMVNRDYNHPSVIMYSIGNEVSEPYEEKGIQAAQEMIQFLHKSDPGRIVTAGINLMLIDKASKGKGIYKDAGKEKANEKSSAKESEKASGSLFFNLIASKVGTQINNMANSKKADMATSPVLDALDVAGYNYASGRYRKDGELHPGRIIVGSETFPQDIAKNWKMVQKYPYLIGDFMWTAWDYIGEAALGAWNYHGTNMLHIPYPWLLADAGAVDIIGMPGAEAAYAAIVWDKAEKPYIGVRPVNHPGVRVSKAVWRGTNAFASWSWKNCENNPAEVEVYGKGEKVELFLNGKSFGKKKLRDFKAKYKIRYMPGTLSAAFFDTQGNVVGEQKLCSAAGQTQIELVQEQGRTTPGSVVFVNVLLTGENGVVESNDDRELQITVENGELLGFGSANPCTEERFDSGRYRTYYGRALAAIRIGSENVKIRVSGKELKEASMVIKPETKILREENL